MKCLNCNHHIEAHTDIRDKGAVPSEGSLSVCFYCGSISSFDKNLNLKPMTDLEIMEVQKEDPESFLLLLSASLMISKRSEQNSLNLN